MPLPLRHRWGPCAVSDNWTPQVVTTNASSHFSGMPYSFIYRLGRLRPSQDFGCFFGSRWDQRSQVQPVAKKSSQKSGCIVQPFGCMCAAIHAAKWLHKCSQMAACLQPKRIYLQPMSAAIWLHVCSHCAAMPKTCSPCAATVSSVQPMCSPCAAIPSCSNPDHARNM